jgi:hypothetical protein
MRNSSTGLWTSASHSAVGSEQADNFARSDSEVDAVDGPKAAVALAQTLGDKNIHWYQ